jgi:hypothetical protein
VLASDHRKGDMQELAGTGTAGDLHRLARGAYSVVIGCDELPQGCQLRCKSNLPVGFAFVMAANLDSHFLVQAFEKV